MTTTAKIPWTVGGYTIQNTTGPTWSTPAQGSIVVKGDATFEGNISLNGINIHDRLDKIEERLGILTPNIELEKNWAELAALRQQYVELERELLEKQRVFDILKKQ